MKKLLLLAIAVVATSCGDRKTDWQIVEEYKSKGLIHTHTYVDGHETSLTFVNPNATDGRGVKWINVSHGWLAGNTYAELNYGLFPGISYADSTTIREYYKYFK